MSGASSRLSVKPMQLLVALGNDARLPPLARGFYAKLGSELAERRLHVLYGARPVDPACLCHPCAVPRAGRAETP